MTSLHPSDLESGTIDSVTSSPRSEHQHDFHLTRVRFMCSFGGKILPRPHDNQLRYVGGDTRIVAVHRSSTFSTLLNKLSKLAGSSNISVKYQLPNEDLDALISVTTDEDVENMLDEYDRVSQNQNPGSARLRLFLFNNGDGEDSRASSISSLLDGSTNREHWFFDAINNGAARGSGLERGRSEASSIVSEVPDYLFGLENSDETQPRELKPKSRLMLQDNVSVSDPGSPAPVVSSPFCSTSSAPIVPSMPDLPPVKTKPHNPDPVLESRQSGQIDGYSEILEPHPRQQTGYSGQPTWHYAPDNRFSTPAVQQMPVYYFPGQVQPGSAPMQQPVPIPAQYVPQYQVPGGGQIPVGNHQQVSGSGQVYGGAVRSVVTTDHSYDQSVRVVSADGMNHQVFYGVRNGGLVPGYPGMMVPGGEELRRSGFDANPGRISQS